jgi:DNA topoisomerase-1
MAKNLVIVESPAKAKTIEGFLGKDFIVKSSYGHVRDLKKRGLAVDVENNFKPEYEVSPDKKKVIQELKDLVKKSEVVWLATDEDREGEAISWHLEETLDLKKKDTRRIVFHEITKSAITAAIESPRKVDYRLVDAQQARRVLDRLVGFEISPILWKKVKPSLSAGRVQSVTVRLIVEREREIQQFIEEVSYRVTADFTIGGKPFKTEYSKRFATPQEAYAFVEACDGAQFVVEEVEVKPATKSPAPPFTTSTLQQEAGRKLGFSVARTMSVAQKLYEEGKITYMRTDSLNLSESAIESARKEITQSYGANFSKPRRFTTKAKGAQEAHEAIRPVDMSAKSVKGDAAEQKLYDLIWKRTLASQMAEARLEKTKVAIAARGNSPVLSLGQFVARGEVIKFEGFLKVYLEGTDDETTEAEEEGLLPAMAKGDMLQRKNVVATQRFSNHPPRYSEASLVKKLEELGIGRPSTYAPTISTVQKRGYVVKEDREGTPRSYTVITLDSKGLRQEQKTENTGAERNKLFPTDIGMVVNDFLLTHFDRVMSYDFTARVEKEFDDIAEGLLNWTEMIRNFYGAFHESVEKTMEESERATGERALGRHPQTGEPVIARLGRYGPMVQIGVAEGDQKPRFASLRKDQSINSITLEEALDIFKLPRELGTFEGEKVTVAEGRFGPYIKHKNAFYSINVKDGDDPMVIEIDRAIEIIESKRKADSERVIKTYPENAELQVLNGRWGPYIKMGKNNYKIPKGTDAAALTFDECMKLVNSETAKPSGKSRTASRAKK